MYPKQTWNSRIFLPQPSKCWHPGMGHQTNWLVLVDWGISGEASLSHSLRPVGSSSSRQWLPWHSSLPDTAVSLSLVFDTSSCHSLHLQDSFCCLHPVGAQ